MEKNNRITKGEIQLNQRTSNKEVQKKIPKAKNQEKFKLHSWGGHRKIEGKTLSRNEKGNRPEQKRGLHVRNGQKTV